MRKLRSSFREQAHGAKKKQMEHDSCLRGVEDQLRTAARQGYLNPEDAEDPMTAAPDYDVRQSGRVLELQKQRPVVTTNRSVLTLSVPHDHSRRTFQDLSCKVIDEIEHQGGQDRGGQEAEDSQKQ